MTRELPPGATTAPVIRRRNGAIAIGIGLLAPVAALIAVLGMPVTPFLVTAVPVSAFLAVMLVRETRRLLGGPSRPGPGIPVEVTGVHRFPPEVRLRAGGGSETWHRVTVPDRHLARVRPGSRGTRHVYEDGVSIVVVDGRTLWLPSWRHT